MIRLMAPSVSYNALRLVQALINKELAAQLTAFLMADAVLAAKAQQKTPDGYYNVERMLKRVVASKGVLLLCGPAWTRGELLMPS